MSGVRAQLAVHGPSGCPVARLATESDTSVTAVNWTRLDEEFTEEFRVDGDVAANGDGALEEAEPVVEVGEERVYQYTRDATGDCVCETIESLGVPVADVRVEPEGVLVVTLHLDDIERLRGIVNDLNGTAERVEVRFLLRESADGDGEGHGDQALIDRDRLTERQREVLRTAYRMGYFEHPRDANATEVADRLGIDTSTFTEHLAAAQAKLLDDLLVV
ncbi:MAG: helix-turn-helix domain-containing protein [Halorientalis sp.]